MFQTRLSVRYAETDAMGIVHHSNFLVYFEVTRVEALDAIGYPYSKMEKNGYLLPVLGVEVEYLSPARFGDKLQIDMKTTQGNGVRLVMQYDITRQEEMICRGKTTHAFVDPRGRPIRPPRDILKLLLNKI